MKGNKYYVYIWTNEINGKRYVGKGHGKRARFHAYRSSNSVIGQAIKKHGRENFSLSILHTNLSEVDAHELESFYITGLKLNVADGGIGYNLTNGGEGSSGWKPSEESRARMSESRRGKSPSEETRKKMSATQKGRPFSAEHRKNLSAAQKRRPPASAESRAKQGATLRATLKRKKEAGSCVS